ncbi:MAG TPA: hypothetical protein IAC62_07335 [Candidatus Pelethocola excrementipullorum]|nr:hypothetical protein [Candidatus Pelethocola excrementipullorum]
MNQKAIRKLRLAHKYQKEALMELLPEKIRGNVLNIDKELKEIARKCITGAGIELMKELMSGGSHMDEEEQEKQQSKVKKVEID